jgi:hypothetical protein
LFRVFLALHFEARALLLQVGGVVAFIGVQLSAIDLGDPFGHVVQEVAIMGDRQDCSRVRGEVLLQPQHAFGVQVVGRLIEQQQVRLLQQQLAQSHPSPLTTGEDGHIGIRRRATERVHGLFQLGIEVPGISRVDGFLEFAHFFEQGVVIRVRIGHLFGNLVEPLDLLEDLADAFLDIAQNRFPLRSTAAPGAGCLPCNPG